jgi:hypothetical protein
LSPTATRHPQQVLPVHRPFEQLRAEDRADRLRQYAEYAPQLLEVHVIWKVNATSQGGGVTEMLGSTRRVRARGRRRHAVADSRWRQGVLTDQARTRWPPPWR